MEEPVKESEVTEEKIASKADIDAILDAVRELTKEIGSLKKMQEDLKKENERWYNAGRFGNR